MAEAGPVRAAEPSEDGILATVLARAFHDDPLMTWLLSPDHRRRLAGGERFFRAELHATRRRGEVLTVEDRTAAALWYPPGTWRGSPSDLLVYLWPAVVAFGPRIWRGLQLLTLVEQAHPHEPHWYLATIGTDPSYAGRGAGGALIGAVLDRCDDEGVGAYLESSKAANVPYYARFGFEVTRELSTANSPTLYAMWRPPR